MRRVILGPVLVLLAAWTAPTAAAAAPSIRADWPTYHGDAARSGYATEHAARSPASRGSSTSSPLDGAVYASPIVVGGVTIVATENDSVYAFDASVRPDLAAAPRHAVAGGRAAVRRHRPARHHRHAGVRRAHNAGLRRRRARRPAAAPAVRADARDRRRRLAHGASTCPASRRARCRSAARSPHRRPGVGAVRRPGRRLRRLQGPGGRHRAGRHRTAGRLHRARPTREAGIWAPPGPGRRRRRRPATSPSATARPASATRTTTATRCCSSSTDGQLLDSFSPSTWADRQRRRPRPRLAGPGAGRHASGCSRPASPAPPTCSTATTWAASAARSSQAPLCRSFGGTAVVGNVVYVPCTDGVRAVRIDSAGTHAPALARAVSAAPARRWSAAVGSGRSTRAAVCCYALDPATGSRRATVSVGRGQPVRHAGDVRPTGSWSATLAGLTVVAPTDAGRQTRRHAPADRRRRRRGLLARLHEQRQRSGPRPRRRSTAPGTPTAATTALRRVRAAAAGATGRRITAPPTAPACRTPCPPCAATATVRVVSPELDGAVYASPIVVGGTLDRRHREQHRLRASTSADRQLWKRHLGAPVAGRELPCGNIDPLGITGTPVSTRRRLVFVAAEFGSPARHELVALDLAHRRGALAPQHRPARRRDAGDAGARRAHRRRRPGLGAVRRPGRRLRRLQGPARRRTRWTAPGAPVAYTVPTAREAGIWTPPGPAVDATGDLSSRSATASPGRRTATTTATRCSSSAPAARLLDSFSPTTWASDNAGDLDLGSQGPALVGQVGVRRRQVRHGVRAAPRPPRRHRRRGEQAPTCARPSAARR